MKVLWITYVMLPEAESLLTGENVQKGSGGWILGAAESLVKYCPGIELSIAIVNRKVKEFTFLRGRNFNYYLIPFLQGFDYYSHCYDQFWLRIKSEFCPDVVHIHGVESALALTYIKACGNENVVVSIQGLVSIISRFYYHDMSFFNVLKNISFRDLVRGMTLFHYEKDFRRRGEIEKQILESIKYVIGRTTWDYDHVWAINSNLKYFICNEILRKEFYSQKWEYSKCEPYTIFLSQASSPFKGAHQLIKALPYVIRTYPQVKVRIAGSSNIFSKSFKQKAAITGYELYLKRLILKNNLSDHIEFLGILSADEMLKEYLRANIFICPSTIENSSNSVAEAQILGTPLIASYVGGIPDMVPNDNVGTLFRVGEYEMLAHDIVDMFEKSRNFDNSEMRELALKRHDMFYNSTQLNKIYESILLK